MSPYEILFGRLRPLDGIPYEPTREAPDASDFLAHMRDMDVKVAKRLNEVHERDAEAVNRKRRPHEPFLPGDRVWFLRPRGPVTGDKMATWWLGPCPVVARTSESTYTIEVKPGVMHSAHVTQLKEYLDEVTGESVPFDYFTSGAQDLDVAPDEWVVNHIVKHRRVKGKLQFLTMMQGVR